MVAWSKKNELLAKKVLQKTVNTLPLFIGKCPDFKIDLTIKHSTLAVSLSGETNLFEFRTFFKRSILSSNLIFNVKLYFNFNQLLMYKKLQCTLLYVITLGQRGSDNINRMLTINDHFYKVLYYICNKWNLWNLITTSSW